MQDNTVRTTLDRVLVEHGAYIPMELMMALGLLSYTQYEAWLRGKIDPLEDALSRDRATVLRVLQLAADRAGELGLVPESHVYAGRGARPLRYFRDDGLGKRLVVQHFRQATGDRRPQLDLFLDSGVTMAVNGLADALLDGEPSAARAQLERLVKLEPGHGLRPAAESLCDALEPSRMEGGRDEILEDLDYVEQILLPAARAVLGPHARDFLAPHWRRVGERLRGVHFDPDLGKAHGSWIYAQVLDWVRVRDSILAEPAWREYPELILRLGEALHRLGDPAGATLAFCQLCWRHPAVAEAALDRDDFWDSGASGAWNEFQDRDNEPELSIEWLPCWLLLSEPGLSRVPAVGGLEVPSDGPSGAFALLGELIRAESGEGGADTRAMEIRKALKDKYPDMLQLYFEKRVRR